MSASGFHVTIERWTVHQAWTGQAVQRWAICQAGLPLLAIYETAEAAEDQARAWGWTIVPSSEDES